jgi:hypothetical protein
VFLRETTGTTIIWFSSILAAVGNLEGGMWISGMAG